MIRRVSRYCCQCGVSMKVLTDTDIVRIEERICLEVSCPTCGQKQLIYAHRIIKIAIDISGKKTNLLVDGDGGRNN